MLKNIIFSKVSFSGSSSFTDLSCKAIVLVLLLASASSDLLAHKQADYMPSVAIIDSSTASAADKAVAIANIRTLFAADKASNMLVINYLVKALAKQVPASFSDKAAKIVAIEAVLSAVPAAPTPAAAAKSSVPAAPAGAAPRVPVAPTGSGVPKAPAGAAPRVPVAPTGSGVPKAPGAGAAPRVPVAPTGSGSGGGGSASAAPAAAAPASSLGVTVDELNSDGVETGAQVTLSSGIAWVDNALRAAVAEKPGIINSIVMEWVATTAGKAKVVELENLKITPKGFAILLKRLKSPSPLPPGFLEREELKYSTSETIKAAFSAAATGTSSSGASAASGLGGGGATTDGSGSTGPVQYFEDLSKITRDKLKADIESEIKAKDASAMPMPKEVLLLARQKALDAGLITDITAKPKVVVSPAAGESGSSGGSTSAAPKTAAELVAEQVEQDLTELLAAFIDSAAIEKTEKLAPDSNAAKRLSNLIDTYATGKDERLNKKLGSNTFTYGAIRSWNRRHKSPSPEESAASSTSPSPTSTFSGAAAASTDPAMAAPVASKDGGSMSLKQRDAKIKDLERQKAILDAIVAGGKALTRAQVGRLASIETVLSTLKSS